MQTQRKPSETLVMLVDATYEHKYVATEPLRILVVDDDPLLREFAVVYLSTPTVTIETAADGAAGLQRLRSEPFDMLLCDIDMPGVSGYDVIHAVRNDPELTDLPIIIITSNEDMASIDQAYDAGATAFVTKPVNWRLLSYQIRFVHRASKASQIAA